MPTRRSQEQANRRLPKPQMVACADCEAEILSGQVHCTGSAVAYGCSDQGPHHGRLKWGRCWKCGSEMGCSLCVPGKRDQHGAYFNDELICTRCRVKANRESLLNGGPVSKHSFTIDRAAQQFVFGTLRRHTPDLGEYPQDWVRQYGYQRIKVGLSPDVDEAAEFASFRKAVQKAFSIGDMPAIPSRAKLNRERNQQVEALAEEARNEVPQKASGD